jgi:hypothetical protein
MSTDRFADLGPPPARAAAVLPIVRAAMARGEGPPAVVAWVHRQGGAGPGGTEWTSSDEARAWVLAACLARRLDARTGETWRPAATWRG